MMRGSCFLAAILVVFSPILLPAEDPAKGHYESALIFLKDQKIPQALEDLSLIVKSFPQSPYADDALFQLGLLSLEQGQSDQALQFFRQIKESYPASDSAPAAYYHMGEIYLSRPDPTSLDEALANFQRVTRVYPDSEWVDESLVGAGTVLRKRNQFDKAWSEFAKVKVRFAAGPIAARAQYEMGVCSLYGNHFLEASHEFQQVIHRNPSSEYAKAALEMNTILYRLYFAPKTAKVYSPDPSFGGTIAELDEPSGMAIDTKGIIYLSDKGKKSVHTLDPSGRITGTSTLLSPYFPALNAQNKVLIANDSVVTWLGRESVSFPNPAGKIEPLDEIRSAAVNASGTYFLVSNKFHGILVYDANRVLTSEFSFSRTEREYYKVLINSRNQILATDKDRRQIFAYGTDGKLLFTLGPSGKGYTIEKIEDFAVDQSNHIYVLEKNPRSVLIFSPSGDFLKYVVSQEKTTLDFDDAKLIAVGPSGSLYLLDKNKRRILKIG